MEFDPDEYFGIPNFERKGLQPTPTAIPRKIIRVPEYCRVFVEQYGDSRSNLHQSHNSSTIYNNNYDRLGVLGELAFQILTNVAMDVSLKPKGDEYDFLINGWSVDVKASSYQYPRLYVKQKRLHENYLYVIGYANLEHLTVEFCGWAPGEYILKVGKYDTSKGQPAYYIESYQLFWMDTLTDIIEIPFTI